MIIEDVKNHLKVITESSTHLEKETAIIKKLQSFGGKLYKYFSFSDEWALENFKNDVIHYSKPQAFNDPFDCSLSLQIDDAIGRIAYNIANQDSYALKWIEKIDKVLNLNKLGIDAKQYTIISQFIQSIFDTSSFQQLLRNEAEFNQNELELRILEELEIKIN